MRRTPIFMPGDHVWAVGPIDSYRACPVCGTHNRDGSMYAAYPAAVQAVTISSSSNPPSKDFESGWVYTLYGREHDGVPDGEAWGGMRNFQWREKNVKATKQEAERLAARLSKEDADRELIRRSERLEYAIKEERLRLLMMAGLDEDTAWSIYCAMSYGTTKEQKLAWEMWSEAYKKLGDVLSLDCNKE